jgi:hypothetical protein
MYSSICLTKGKYENLIFGILLLCFQLIFGCTTQKIEKPTPKENLSYPLPGPGSKIQVKTWEGNPDLEPGLNGSDILLFEDFETPSTGAKR